MNALVPALLSGNAVILKPSPQTPSPADNMAQLLLKAGLPDGVCQSLHLSIEQVDMLVAHPKVDFVSFTGSVKNGYRVEENARGTRTGAFKNVNLELGGKDPAYVREGVLPLPNSVDCILMSLCRCRPCFRSKRDCRWRIFQQRSKLLRGRASVRARQSLRQLH